jgi:c-di-GMP-binding flagellar brake protein YcgR
MDQAVRERALAILTYQDGRDWTTFKSRFLECDPKGRFFVLDYQSVNEEPLPPVAPGQYMGVSFRQKSRKILFSTVVEAKGHYVLEDKTAVPAVRYRWPNSLTELQRRAYYRTPVPPTMALLANMWAGGVTARQEAQASSLQVVTGDLADLSCGGAMIRLHQTAPPEWVDGELVGVELQMPDGREPLQLDARYRGVRHDDHNRLGAAVQFIGLELTVDGRVVLQRLAGSVQRLHRLSIASGRRDWGKSSNQKEM